MFVPVCITLLAMSFQQQSLPEEVKACLSRHADLQLSERQIPPFLFPHFLGRDERGLVIAVHHPDDDVNGVVVCTKYGKDRVFLAEKNVSKSADDKSQFQMSSQWTMCS
jgi:hypothetical protein